MKVAEKKQQTRTKRTQRKKQNKHEEINRNWYESHREAKIEQVKKATNIKLSNPDHKHNLASSISQK